MVFLDINENLDGKTISYRKILRESDDDWDNDPDAYDGDPLENYDLELNDEE